MQQQSKCLVCDKRPAKTAAGLCLQCAQKIEHQQARSEKLVARYYIHWKGNVMGLYRDGPETYKGVLERLDVSEVPKSRLIDIDHYVPGYSRDQIKKFKRDILTLAR